MTDEVKVYLSLNRKNLEASKKRAIEEDNEENPNEKIEDKSYLYGDSTLMVNDFFLNEDKDAITLNGNLHCFNKEIAWIDLQIPLTQVFVVEVIDRWMKRLGKLKTVLEATK